MKNISLVLWFISFNGLFAQEKIQPFMVCDYDDVAYEAVAAPDQTPDWQIVKWVKVKAAGYEGKNFVRPFAVPAELTFEVDDNRTVTIKNSRFSLEQILMGEKYRRGQAANRYINDSLVKVAPARKRSVLRSFTLKKTEPVFFDEDLSRKLENPYRDDLEAIENFLFSEEIKELGAPAEIPDFELKSLQQLLATERDPVGLRFLNNKLTVRRRSAFGENLLIFSGKVGPLLMKRWNLTEKQLKDSVTVYIKNGNNEGILSPGNVTSWAASVHYHETRRLNEEDRQTLDALKKKYGVEPSDYLGLDDMRTVDWFLSMKRGRFDIKLNLDPEDEQLKLTEIGPEGKPVAVTLLYGPAIPLMFHHWNISPGEAEFGTHLLFYNGKNR